MIFLWLFCKKKYFNVLNVNINYPHTQKHFAKINDMVVEERQKQAHKLAREITTLRIRKLYMNFNFFNANVLLQPPPLRNKIIFFLVLYHHPPLISIHKSMREKLFYSYTFKCIIQYESSLPMSPLNFSLNAARKLF